MKTFNISKTLLTFSLTTILFISGCSSTKAPTVSSLDENSMFVQEGEEKSISFVPDTNEDYYILTRSDKYEGGNISTDINTEKLDISNLNDGELTISESLHENEIRRSVFIVPTEEVSDLVEKKLRMSPQDYNEPVVISKITDSNGNVFYTDHFSHIQLISKEKATLAVEENLKNSSNDNNKDSESKISETYSDESLKKFTIENISEGQTIEISGESDGVVTSYLKTIYDEQISSDISSGGQFSFYFNPSVPKGGSGSFHVELKNVEPISFNIKVY
ncbi:hypothetical protein [Vagococcus fluvialis]|uniref:hypothetical protein n=1 Tax=Vagococcus fluvialis TaxID=2738 RepID=UPI001D0A304F|nr:hypothetical protein [Vagococcus fluvialis]UDM72643.1 hypothetical protein K5L00_14745 [Vagococcus fluvialis]UDM78366.1 hypothetical protein K5K98_14950 [Vagococcus fluvialis]UDM83918.1 hypothetical protein K5K96_14770 [Vagococcus fluvialis]